MAEILTQQWKFTVSAPNTGPNRKIFITGNIPELGEWDTKQLVIMEQETADLWCITVTIPNTCDIFYRYGICSIHEPTNDVLIYQWETSLHPRIITESMLHPFIDTYGEISGKTALTRGWLTDYTMLQFKLFNNPLKLKHKVSQKPIYIKVTPVKLSFGEDPQGEESSVSTDTMDTNIASGVLVEVSTLDNDPAHCVLKPQEQFGRMYRPDDLLVVNVTVPDYSSLAYLIDLYSYSSRAASDDPPCHVGYTYVLPNMLKSSVGILDLPVTCNVKNRPLGTIHIEYLIIKPMPENMNNFEVSYSKYWEENWTGLEVGHRGLGASFKTKGHAIRENTIASLKQAAASGADLLEFDVQLSKDMVPVIYHDFHVCISMKRKKELEYAEMLELPVKDLTLEQLQKLKVYHLVECRNHDVYYFDEDLEDHQPFPTLEHAMNSIEKNVGFNVELKWTMELKDGTYELDDPFDMNTYVDKVLEVVLKHAGDRRIVFSCFNPDICTMVRYKQNKYPVMFLTVGITTRYEPYRDPRCISIPVAIQSAVNSDILGLVVHTEDLLRDPSQVKLVTDAGLVIFCWGDDNNDKKTIKKLKDMGLHAVIYDKIDQYISKEVKESIFLVEMRDPHRDFMQLGATEDETAQPQPSPASSINTGSSQQLPAFEPAPEPQAYLDLLSVRKTIQDTSTATSLESLASSVQADDIPRPDIITTDSNESQLKEQITTFKDLFPKSCKKGPPQQHKRSRLN